MTGTPRTPIALMRDRSFAPFFFGKLASSLGIWIQNVAAAILVWELTHSATLVGAISIAQFAPQLVVTPFVGVLADRGSRRGWLMAGRALSGLGAGVLGLYVLLVGIEGIGGAGPVIAASLVFGLGLAFSAPAMQALIPALVPSRDLEGAVALSSTTASVARAAGPALGAVLYAVLGPGPVFLISAGGHVAFIIGLLFVADPAAPRSSDRSPFSGFSYALRTRRMLWLLLGVGAIGLTADPVVTLTPPLAELAGHGELLIGALASAFGLGALAGVWVLQPLQLRYSVGTASVVGMGLLLAGYVSIAAFPVASLALVAMTVGGVGFILATSSLTSRIQRLVPEHLRGRVMALWSIAFIGTRPIAAAVNGLVTDLLNVQIAFLLAAVIAGVAGAGLWRLRGVPDQRTVASTEPRTPSDPPDPRGPTLESEYARPAPVSVGARTSKHGANMPNGHARVLTDAPERYAKQLVSHFGRKNPVEDVGDGQRVTLSSGTVTIRPLDEGVLLLAAAADTAEELEHLQDVVGRHLERFGERADLSVTWQSGTDDR